MTMALHKYIGDQKVNKPIFFIGKYSNTVFFFNMLWTCVPATPTISSILTSVWAAHPSSKMCGANIYVWEEWSESDRYVALLFFLCMKIASNFFSKK